MKKLLLTIAFKACCLVSLLAQPCLPEGINFTTQAQIDSFQINYPGCTDIIGNVQIIGEDITNLNGLNVLTAFGGNLHIGEYNSLISCNPGLFDLSGLDNVVAVDGDLVICQNDSLINLTGLNNLVAVGKGLTINGNYSLSSLSGLDNLETIGENLIISGNNALTGLSGLGNLSYIFGEFRIGDIFNNNPSLINLSGLDNLYYIGGDFIIRNNDNLVSLIGLSNLTILGEDFIINSNNILPDLTGLENIISIEGEVLIGDYFFGGNPALTSLTGLENLTSIGGDFEIYHNPLLTNLSGLTNLTSIGSYIKIYYNTALESLLGIENLNNIEGGLYIYQNASLTACDVESICDYLVNPNGEIVIHDNALGCNSQQEVEEACEAITSVSEIIPEDSFSISPNPCSGSANLQLVISDHGLVTFELFEISGVRTKTILNEEKIPGIYEMEIDLSDLQKGIYFCVLKTSNGICTKKIIKL